MDLIYRQRVLGGLSVYVAFLFNGTTMFLYHYSSTKYSELLTRRAQGGLTDDQIEQSEAKANSIRDPGPYIDHLSLFVEPIPYKTLPAIFHNEHHFWKKDKLIYEHVIDTKDLPSNLVWSLVETPEMDKFTDQFDWGNATPELRQSYIVKMNEEMEKRGFTGKGVFSLETKAKKYVGKTERFYKEARKRSDAEDTKNQYAACVPHLMIYPKEGIVKVQAVNKVLLGSGIVSDNPPLHEKW